MSISLHAENSIRRSARRKVRQKSNSPLDILPRQVIDLTEIYFFKKDITDVKIVKTGMVVSEKETCSCCGGKVYRSEASYQRYVDIPEEGKPTEIFIEITSYKCKKCKQKTAFIPKSLAKKRSRLTNRAIQYILSSYGKTQTVKDLAIELGVSEKTIRNVRNKND